MSHWYRTSVVHCDEHEDCEPVIIRNRVGATRHNPFPAKRPDKLSGRIIHYDTPHEALTSLRAFKPKRKRHKHTVIHTPQSISRSDATVFIGHGPGASMLVRLTKA